MQYDYLACCYSLPITTNSVAIEAWQTGGTIEHGEIPQK